MAEGTIVITLRWENQEFFEATSKKDDGDTITIVRVEEDGNIAAVWPHVGDIIKEQIRRDLDTIGSDMKEPAG